MAGNGRRILFGTDWRNRCTYAGHSWHGGSNHSYAHGVALAQAIGKAELLTLEGTGHELHQKDWDCIIEAISKHSIKHRSTQ